MGEGHPGPRGPPGPPGPPGPGLRSVSPLPGLKLWCQSPSDRLTFSVSICLLFQTFVDMEGSGFPDLESVRVRRTNPEMWRRSFLVESPLLVLNCPSTCCASLCRAHLVHQAHQVHQVPPLSPQPAQSWARAPLDHQDGMELRVNL